MTAQMRENREPTAREKRDQLERVLASPIFERLLKPAALLRFLVENDIAGVELDEHTIGVRLFDRKPDWITMDDSVVRQNLTRLRKLLDAYFATDGIEDRLNLELPVYKSKFSYNPRHPAERLFRRAERHIGSDPGTALRLLGRILNDDPHHAEAIAANAEIELWRPFSGTEHDLPALLDRVQRQAAEALCNDARCWRAHLVLGALHCCRHDWKEAETAFGAALAGSVEKTLAHPWYAAYLMSLGRIEEALLLVKARAATPTDMPWPQLSYAVFLYAARRYGEAEDVIHRLNAEHADTWLVDILMYLVVIARDHCRSAYDRLYLGALTVLRSPLSYSAYPVINILLQAYELDPDYIAYEVVRGGIEDMARIKLTGWERPQGYPVEGYKGERFLSAFQLAIGYLTIGDESKAIELLRRDLGQGHPMMVWLAFWPVFDPLREVPAFRSLVAGMKLPAAL